MVSRLNLGGLLMAAVVCVAMLVLSLSAGCGGDSTSDRKVVVQTKKPTPSPVLALSTPVVNMPEVVEPKDSVDTEPELIREVSYEEAEAAFHEKRYEDAVKLFTRYTERKTENPWGFYMLGLSSWQAGEFEVSVQSFVRAIELDPRHTKSYLNLGRVFLDTDRPAEALTSIDQALTIDAESNVTYRLRGRALHELGRIDEAKGSFQRAILLDHHDVWSMNSLGLIYIGEGHYCEALSPLARAVKLSDVAVFQNNLGMALERVGQFRSAENAYASAVAIDPSYENASANFDRISQVLQDPELEPLDLAEIAQEFMDEIDSWGETMVASEQPVDPEQVFDEEPETTEPEEEVEPSESDETP